MSQGKLAERKKVLKDIIKAVHAHESVDVLVTLDSGMFGAAGSPGSLDCASMAEVLAAAQLTLEALGVPVEQAVFIDVGSGYGLALLAALASGFHVAVGIEAGMGGCHTGRRGGASKGSGGGPCMALESALASLHKSHMVSVSSKCEVLWETMIGNSDGKSSTVVNYVESSDAGFSWGFSHVFTPAACKVCFAFDAVFVEVCKQALLSFVCHDTSVKVFFTTAFNVWSKKRISDALAGSFVCVRTLDTKMLLSNARFVIMVFVRV